MLKAPVAIRKKEGKLLGNAQTNTVTCVPRDDLDTAR
jgi:hypothetical protein